MSDIVIEVADLWKEYRLGTINHGTLSRDLQSWWAKLRGKADPNSPVAEKAVRHRADERFWALQDISFAVKQGDILGIIGRNGAGKSTLLKILSQVTAPTRGEVRFNGRIASLLEVGTGFHPELTGRENIFLNGALFGMSKADISKKLDNIISFAEVERFLDTPVKRYSSGMYVRLAFAVAAHLESEILVVDEVLAVGDAQFQKKCLGKMEEVRKEGRTILFVSHNIATINTLCSRVIVMDKGRITHDGSNANSIKSYLEASIAASNMIVDADGDEQLPITIKHASMRDEAGNIAAVLDYHMQYYIYLCIKIRDKDRDYYASVGVYDDFGNLVIFTADDDLLESRLSRADEGEYWYRLKLPVKLLKPGSYQFVITMNKRTRGASIQVTRVVLSSEMRDTVSRRAMRKAYRPSMVAPEIVWEYIDDGDGEHEYIARRI